MLIFFVLASAAFVIASILDALSSIGKRERFPIYRDRDGRFDPRRYVLVSAAGFVAILLIARLAHVWLFAVALLAGLAAWRIWAAIHNRRIKP